jgi:hypothetical protein
MKLDLGEPFKLDIFSVIKMFYTITRIHDISGNVVGSKLDEFWIGDGKMANDIYSKIMLEMGCNCMVSADGQLLTHYGPIFGNLIGAIKRYTKQKEL